jgi:hypothetical protein
MSIAAMGSRPAMADTPYTIVDPDEVSDSFDDSDVPRQG